MKAPWSPEEMASMVDTRNKRMASSTSSRVAWREKKHSTVEIHLIVVIHNVVFFFSYKMCSSIKCWKIPFSEEHDFGEALGDGSYPSPRLEKPANRGEKHCEGIREWRGKGRLSTQTTPDGLQSVLSHSTRSKQTWCWLCLKKKLRIIRPSIIFHCCA